jgi:hypothetical protein
MRTTEESNQETPRRRYWRGLVAEWQCSGVTQTEFCRQRGVNQGTFNWWKRQLARRSREPAADRAAPPSNLPTRQVAFAPIRIQGHEDRVTNGALEIVLPGDRRLRLSGPVDRQQLIDVLAVLEAAAC